MGENARLKIGHARVETHALKTLACRNGLGKLLKAKVESLSACFENARVEKSSLNICIQRNAGTAYTEKCGNSLHIGVHSKNANVSEFASQPF